MIGTQIMGSSVIASYTNYGTIERSSNAMFMSDENVDTPTKITANTSDSNALFME